jgi:hypothetical protein
MEQYQCHNIKALSLIVNDHVVHTLEGILRTKPGYSLKITKEVDIAN